MRSILVTCTVLLSTVLSPVLALGERGAAERILYFYAYLAQQVTVSDPAQWIVAPGCRGANGPCSFNEFCEYIWAETVNPNAKPTPINDVKAPTGVDIVHDGELFENLDIGTVFARIQAWKDANTGYGVNGNSDSSKVVPGSVDYYDALSRVGGPIGDLAALQPSLLDSSGKATPASTRAKILSGKGKSAAALVHDLRFKDIEQYRIKAIKAKLGSLGAGLKTRPGRCTLNIPTSWNTIDAPSSIDGIAALNGGDRAGAQTALGTAIGQWENGSDNAKKHWAALLSADSAQRLCACKK